MFKSNNNAMKHSLIDAGIVSQNISVFCEIYGLKSIVRGDLGDPKKMRELLNLDEDKEPILAQSIGFLKPKPENASFDYLE